MVMRKVWKHRSTMYRDIRVQRLSSLPSRFQCYHGAEISQHDLRITLVQYVDDLT